MNTKTFEDYKNAILAQYQKSKNGVYASYLINPTRSGLRELALLLYENATAADKMIYSEFFQMDESKDKKKQIENFNVDRFRALCSFFGERNSLRNKPDANLAAMLVDFNPRPFYKFHHENTVATEIKDKEPEIIAEGIERNKDFENRDARQNIQAVQHVVNKKNGGIENKKVTLWGGGVMVLLCLYIWFFFKEEKKCMVWKDDHYEEANCNDIALQREDYKLARLNTTLLGNMKKVTVCDTTTFFKHSKPCIWYGKSADKRYEYFTYPGVHPETGESLKKITRYMISRNVKACK